MTHSKTPERRQQVDTASCQLSMMRRLSAISSGRELTEVGVAWKSVAAADQSPPGFVSGWAPMEGYSPPTLSLAPSGLFLLAIWKYASTIFAWRDSRNTNLTLPTHVWC